MVSDPIRRLAPVLVVVLSQRARAGRRRPPAGAQPYEGPIFRGVTTYAEHGEPYDFSHGAGADDAARAADIASSSAAVGHVMEVGLIAPASTTEDGCGSCVQVALIDYDAGLTHNVIVDVATDEIVADAVQETVVAALGEDGIRSLYGIALHDPEVAERSLTPSPSART